MRDEREIAPRSTIGRRAFLRAGALGLGGLVLPRLWGDEVPQGGHTLTVIAGTARERGRQYGKQFQDGIRRWPVAEWTRTYGAPGEIDDEGVIRKISVVPKPYQQPHPPMFQPFSVSESTIRYTAQSGIVPWILVANPPDFRRLAQLYKDTAAEAGRDLKLGQGVGAFRAVTFGDTEQQAAEMFERTQFFGFNAYFAGFGFWEAFRFGEDAEKYPLEPYTPLPSVRLSSDR